MPTLHFKGKTFVQNQHLAVKYHQLVPKKALSLTEQKRNLCELLDKNQLYVNRSSLHDADFACTEVEKKVTQDFYQIKKK